MKNLVLKLALLGIFAGLTFSAIAQTGVIYEKEQPVNGLVPDSGIINKKPIPYPPLREADIMWSKRVWRVIDMRQKMNQPFYYPLEAHNDWKSFMTIIMDAIKLDSITAYDITPTDEYNVPLKYSEIINRQVDTLKQTLTRPYPPYDDYDTVIYTEFDPSKVMRIRIKEDWFFDKQRSQMMCRIIGICPVMMKERDGEEYPEPLFWIYYPEARPILAQALVFNRENNAEKRTYDEVFIKRMFTSFIYKESNVYDRRISQYASGLDALLESERIKNELYQYEHDLWSF